MDGGGWTGGGVQRYPWMNRGVGGRRPGEERWGAKGRTERLEERRAGRHGAGGEGVEDREGAKDDGRGGGGRRGGRGYREDRGGGRRHVAPA